MSVRNENSTSCRFSLEYFSTIITSDRSPSDGNRNRRSSSAHSMPLCSGPHCIRNVTRFSGAWSIAPNTYVRLSACCIHRDVVRPSEVCLLNQIWSSESHQVAPVWQARGTNGGSMMPSPWQPVSEAIRSIMPSIVLCNSNFHLLRGDARDAPELTRGLFMSAGLSSVLKTGSVRLKSRSNARSKSHAKKRLFSD